MREVRYGSSPKVSPVLPQRGSLAMLTTGANTWRIPRALTSSEIASATLVIRLGSHELASAIDWGKAVDLLPMYANMASPDLMAGIPRRVLLIRYC